MKKVFSSLLLLVVISACSTKSAGQPSGFALEPVFPNAGLVLPVWMQQPPNDASVWFAVEQQGRIVRFANRSDAKKSVALDITDRVKYGGEQGLLGFAFDPGFPEVPHLYVNYTSTESGKRETRISRFTTRDAGTTFDKKSEQIVLRYAQPYANHNGGQVSFGPDGFLYIGIGDGGSGDDPHGYGQNLDSLLGTIARIDVRNQTTYAIPKDNPFSKRKKGKEIYAWGLRNPWRFSWDDETKKLWVGDVGQNAYEEIDVVEKGKNYGWAKYEGKHCFQEPCSSTDDMVAPVIEYSQKNGDRSVTGGYVYRGTKMPELVGHYIYADFVSGRVWAYDLATKKNRLILESDFSISSFVEGADKEIGVLDYSSGTIYHLTKK